MSEVKRHLISDEKLREWIQESTKTNQSPWYEIAATNCIAQNAHLISGEPPVRVWVEMKLGNEEEGDASHPDVIIETKDRLFVVEVKYTDSEIEANTAEIQALDYVEKIKNIGWWSNIKTKIPVVIWVHYNVEPDNGVRLA